MPGAASVRRLQTGFRETVLRHLGWSGLSERQTRRRLQLIAGLAAALAGIILSGFLMAQTLIVGAPPWQEPTRPALPDRALLAAAEQALQHQGQSARPTPQPAATVREPAMASGQAQDEPAEPVATTGSTSTAAPEESAIPGTAESEAEAPAPDGKTSPASASSTPRTVMAQGQPKAARPAAPAEPVRAPQPAAPSIAPGPVEKRAEDRSSRSDTAAPDTRRSERSERRVTQTAASPAWYASMKAQLNRCSDEPNLFDRIVCAEKTKFRFCSPNRWGQVAECVKTQHRDVNDLHHVGGWLHQEPTVFRQYAGRLISASPA